METRPIYVPAAKLPGFTDTVSAAGAVPEVGVTDSQFPPDVVETAAVKFGVALDSKLTVCGGGKPPTEKIKESAAGDADRLAEPTTVNVTGTVCGPAAVEMATVPA